MLIGHSHVSEDLSESEMSGAKWRCGSGYQTWISELGKNPRGHLDFQHPLKRVLLTQKSKLNHELTRSITWKLGNLDPSYVVWTPSKIHKRFLVHVVPVLEVCALAQLSLERRTVPTRTVPSETDTWHEARPMPQVRMPITRMRMQLGVTTHKACVAPERRFTLRLVVEWVRVSRDPHSLETIQFDR